MLKMKSATLRFSRVAPSASVHVQSKFSTHLDPTRRFVASNSSVVRHDPCSTEYELIYTSETFDDVSDICPSLLAYIKTFKDMDTQLRLSIYYNSSITGSKVYPSPRTFSPCIYRSASSYSSLSHWCLP